MNRDLLIEKWKRHENKRIRNKYRIPVARTPLRPYSHFDKPVPPSYVVPTLKDESLVASHAFRPFLRYHEKQRKMTPDEFPPYSNKIRKISYACHVDSHIYSFYEYLLRIPYEAELVKRSLDECVLAYRASKPTEPPRSTTRFAKEVFDEILRRKECTVLTFDIEKFFDEISHKILKKTWMELLGCDELPSDHFNVYKSLAQFRFVPISKLLQEFGFKHRELPRIICSPADFRDRVKKKGLVKNNGSCGIPQGSSMSGLLSNVSLLEFDTQVKQFVEKSGGVYRRYSDDLIVITDSNNKYAIKAFVEECICKASLKINPDKTKEFEFKPWRDACKCIGYVKRKKRKGYVPLQYLGFQFDGHTISIRDKTIARFLRKMTAGIARHENQKKKKTRILFSQGKVKFRPQISKKRISFKYSLGKGNQNFFTYAAKAHLGMGKRSRINKQILKLQADVKRHADAAQQRLEVYKPKHKKKVVSK